MLNLDTALKFNESNIKNIEFDILNIDEAISSINVSYYDRNLIKNSSFLLYENGLQRTRGFDVSDNVDFPYFMNRTNAEKVGNWKLKQLSSPTWKGSFKTGIVEARNINKYDVVKLSWLNKNLIDLPVRVMNINLGDGLNNTVIIDFIEVILYSNIDYSNTDADEPINNRLSPLPNLNTAFEMPYYEAVQQYTQTQVDLELNNSPEIGYLIASAVRPQNNSLNAVLYTDGATGSSINFQQVGIVNYCPAVYLDQEIGYIETVFKVKNTEFNASKFTGATSGTWVILNDEIMVYESFNELTNEITVKRGALDTVPHKHVSGTIFFSDEFSGVDSTQYIQSEDVKYRVLTTTPSAMENIDFSSAKIVEFNARAIRPYPPANVKINGEYYPEAEIIEDIKIDFVDRNRGQQTGGNIIGWFDEGITKENGVTYSYELKDSDNDNIVDSADNISNSFSILKSKMAINNRLEIFSKRDGFESFQRFEYSFIKSSIELWTPEYLSKLIWLDANDEVPDANSKIFTAHDKSGNGFNFTSSVGMLMQNAATISSKFFVSDQSGLISSTLAASQFNGKRFAYVFMLINENESIEGYFYNIGDSRFEVGAYRIDFQRYVVNTHSNGGGTWNAYSPNIRKFNSWKMLLVQVDLQEGIKIFVDGKIDTDFISTPSQTVFSNNNGSSIQFINSNSQNRIRCATMLTGNSDISLDREKLFGWAAHKYGLTANLPADHPYKYEAPLV